MQIINDFYLSPLIKLSIVENATDFIPKRIAARI